MLYAGCGNSRNDDLVDTNDGENVVACGPTTVSGAAVAREEFDVAEDEAANAEGGFIPGERESIVARRPIDSVGTPRAVKSFNAGVRDPSSVARSSR